MSYAITIVADTDDVNLLQAAAEDVPDVTLTPPQSLETAGDGLNFPAEPAWVQYGIEGLRIVAAFVSTANGIRQLIEAWSKRRAQSPVSEESQRLPVLVTDTNSGRVIYRGVDLNSDVANSIATAVDKLPDHEQT